MLPRFALAWLLAGAHLSGCIGAPVQEMSNARQAVRAAQKAGAEQHAPTVLAEAQKLLDQAKGNLQHGEYRAARDQAEQARAKPSMTPGPITCILVLSDRISTSSS